MMNKLLTCPKTQITILARSISTLLLSLAFANGSMADETTYASADNDINSIQVWGAQSAGFMNVAEFNGRRGVGPAMQKREPSADRQIERLDVNEDGVIDAEEFLAGRGENVDLLFSRHDADGDGLLTQDELVTRPAPTHPRGQRPARPERGERPERAERPELGGRPGRPELDREAVLACVRETLADFNPEPVAEDRFELIDTNADGYIDLAELSIALQERAHSKFNRLDTDGNGQVTLAELEAAHEQQLSIRRVVNACVKEALGSADSRA